MTCQTSVTEVHNSNLGPDTDCSDCAFLWFSSDHPCRFRGGTYCFLQRPSRLIRPTRHLISCSTLRSPSYRPWCYTDCTKYRNPHRPSQSNTQHFCFLFTEVPHSNLVFETGERILSFFSYLQLMQEIFHIFFQIKPRRIPLHSCSLLSDHSTILRHYWTTNFVTK